MRINKYIASSGVASRRKADALIKSGLVSRNGRVVTELGTDVDSERDVITVHGRRIQPPSEYVYLALHKPVGYVCTHARFEKERSIFSLLPRQYQQLNIAGRLDKDSEGLVILSDDGEFIQELMHPKYEKEKEYLVTLDRPLSPDAITRLHRGIKLEEGVARADELTQVKGSTYRLVLHQGWKRQIRRMMEAVGAPVRRLVRERVGRYQLGRIPSGKYQEIKK